MNRDTEELPSIISELEDDAITLKSDWFAAHSLSRLSLDSDAKIL